MPSHGVLMGVILFVKAALHVRPSGGPSRQFALLSC